jgi:hypothetical protein
MWWLRAMPPSHHLARGHSMRFIRCIPLELLEAAQGCICA